MPNAGWRSCGREQYRLSLEKKFSRKYGPGLKNELLFYPEAEEEFNQAIDYYNDVEQGLGDDFAYEIYTSIRRVVEFPKAWPVLENEVRRRNREVGI